jgi:hypothetical protein
MGGVFDYAIFVQCVSPGRLHDYFNNLIRTRILFASIDEFANKKSLRKHCAGFSWLYDVLLLCSQTHR